MMERSTDIEAEILALLERFDGNVEGVTVLFCSARIFGLIKSLSNAPSLKSVEAFFQMYSSIIPLKFREYMLDIYKGKRPIPYLAKTTDTIFIVDGDEYFSETKAMNTNEFLSHYQFFEGTRYSDYDELIAKIIEKVKVFVRIECNIYRR